MYIGQLAYGLAESSMSDLRRDPSFHRDPRMQVSTRTAVVPLPPEGFTLVSGMVLPALEIAYETYGTLNADRSNAVLICSPLTTDAHAAGWYTPEDKAPGWWDDMVGPGKAIDTERYFVIGQNMLGGCRGTTGPASLNPKTGHPYGSDFPAITIEDMVHAQRLLIESLGIDALAAVVGGSMGGMQALQWSISYPTRVRKCMCIAAAPSLSAQALGFEIIGRKVIVNDPHFYGGDYYDKAERPDAGLAFARMIGHITYLSAAAMHQKFGRRERDSLDSKRFETGFEVESYLTHQGNKFVERFDANSYLHITWAMDHFDLEARYGSLEKAFENSQTEFLLVALSSDWLFFPEQTRQLAQALMSRRKIVSLIELESPYGHDAFLLEVAHLSRVIHGFLEKSEPAEPAITSSQVTLEQAATVPAGKVQRTGPRPFSEIESLASLIIPGSHILDIGCGQGELIDTLYHRHGVTGIGIDFDLDHVVACLRHNVPVVQADVDAGLSMFRDGAFDYAVLNRTLQEMKRPRMVLREILRVARKGVVAFPNFGHAGNRASLLMRGRMPVTRALPHSWDNTPNIHLFSLQDFRALCAEEGMRIEKELCFAGAWKSRLLMAAGLPNAGAEYVIALISRA
jgi:homoserine O-acetyltransferase/O-succinyltransferase